MQYEQRVEVGHSQSFPPLENYTSGYIGEEWESVRNMSAGYQKSDLISRIFKDPYVGDIHPIDLTFAQTDAFITEITAAYLDSSKMPESKRQQAELQKYIASLYIRDIAVEEIAEQLGTDLPRVRLHIKGFIGRTRAFFARQPDPEQTSHFFLDKVIKEHPVPIPRQREPQPSPTPCVPRAETAEDGPKDQAASIIKRIFKDARLPNEGDWEHNQTEAMLSELLKIHEEYFQNPDKVRESGQGAGMLAKEREFSLEFAKGDTLELIARKHGLTVASIRRYISKFVSSIWEIHNRDEAQLQKCLDTIWRTLPQEMAPEQAMMLAQIALSEQYSDLLDEAGTEEQQNSPKCERVDPEIFFPEEGEDDTLAKRICNACPIRSGCLALALARNEEYGIWGGLNEDERKALRARRSSIITEKAS